MTEHSEHWYDYTRNDPNRKNPFMTHEEMLEEADRRVRENMKRAAELDALIHKAIEENGPALKELAEMERDELADLAIQELGWIVAGGQDGEEFYNSIMFIKKVLERLKNG